MLPPIGSVNSTPALSPGLAPGASPGVSPDAPASASGQVSFKNMLLDSVRQVNSMQLEANQAVEGLFTGSEINPAEVLTAVQKADLAFRMLMQVRNKLVSAYQEIKDVKV